MLILTKFELRAWQQVSEVNKNGINQNWDVRAQTLLIEQKCKEI